jgi:hypothetical protein
VRYSDRYIPGYDARISLFRRHGALRFACMVGLIVAAVDILSGHLVNVYVNALKVRL